MPRLLPELFRIEQNQLASNRPMAFLAELDYEDGVERITNEPQGITFQGVPFRGDVPLAIERFSEPSLSESIRLAITIGNASQLVSFLAETYWMTKLDPVWKVTLWLVDATQPDIMPVSSNVGVYEVLSIELDEINARFILYEPTISNTRTLPADRVAPPLFPFARVRN